MVHRCGFPLKVSAESTKKYESASFLLVNMASVKYMGTQIYYVRDRDREIQGDRRVSLSQQRDGYYNLTKFVESTTIVNL